MTNGGPEKADESDPRHFVLERTRHEVHLLLDNLSANPEATIHELSEDNPPPDDLPDNWIDRVCRITWPPDQSEEGEAEQAKQAALLIRVKDYLNSLAKPASGATIAFTLLVTQEENRSRDEEQEQEEKEEREEKKRLRAKEGPHAPSRSSLASKAYPDLEAKARRFRTLMRFLSWLPLFWLALTVAVSWYVTVGNAALADVAKARTAVTDASARVAAAQAALNAPSGVADARTTQQAARTPESHTRDFCRPRGALRPSFRSGEALQACTALEAAGANLAALERALDRWAWWGGDKTTAPWGVALLATAVLPVLYGVLGAIAAVVRSLSNKIRRSVLSPRDIQLTLQQLALGAVIGTCISLFIADPDTGTEATLLGPVTLSTSAISFVAGFGVETVFVALEALISRIFNVAPAAAADPAVPASRDPRRRERAERRRRAAEGTNAAG